MKRDLLKYRNVKTVLFRVPFFFTLICGLFFSACGDLSAGPVVSDARFSRSFRYYYETNCRYDGHGIYGCDRSSPLSPPYVVRIRVDGSGDATLNLDGESYFYREGSFDERNDGDGWYFSFYEDNEVLDIYKDGSEMIFWDTWNNTVTIYSYDLPY